MFGHKEVARIHEEHVALLRDQIVEMSEIAKGAVADSNKANKLSEGLIKNLNEASDIIASQKKALDVFERTFAQLGDTQ